MSLRPVVFLCRYGGMIIEARENKLTVDGPPILSMTIAGRHDGFQAGMKTRKKDWLKYL